MRFRSVAEHPQVIRLGKGAGEGGHRLSAGPLALAGLVLGALLAPKTAQAEEAEAAVGVEGALVLPALASKDATAVSLATWGLGVYGRYGLLDDLDLSVRSSFAAFGGQLATTRDVRSRIVPGALGFDLQQVHLEAGARWKLFAGYNLAPYVEAHVGWMWSIYRNQRFTTENGQDLGVEIPNEGRGAFSASVGLAVDYRLLNLLFVGVAVRWTEILGDPTYRRYVSAPVQVAFYW